jgi:hypothetical protein
MPMTIGKAQTWGVVTGGWLARESSNDKDADDWGHRFGQNRDADSRWDA